MDAEIECRKEFEAWWDKDGCRFYALSTKEDSYHVWAEAWLKSAEAALSEVQKILGRKL